MNSVTPATLSEQTTISEQFNSPDADITYMSSDGVRFRIHSVNLRAHTEGIAPPVGSALQVDEVVQLTESAQTLELLFTYIYPRPFPDLTTITFKKFMDVAEAADKYQVFPAMRVCEIWMRERCGVKQKRPNNEDSDEDDEEDVDREEDIMEVEKAQNALRVLAFALRHYHPELIDDMAPYVLDRPVYKVLAKIPSEFHGPWLRYYNQYQQLQRRALTEYLPKDPYDWIISRIASLRRLTNPGPLIFNRKINMEHTIWEEYITSDTEKMLSLNELISGKKKGVESTENACAQNEEPLENELGNLVVQESLTEGAMTIVSADGAKYTLDPSILSVGIATFAGYPSTTSDHTISVTETSRALSLLLRFVKPVRVPDLSHLPFDVLKELAYASENYKIYPARYFSRLTMKERFRKHPSEIFAYAGEYGYLDILDVGAPVMIGSPCEEVVKLLPLALQSAWRKYYDTWMQLCEDLVIHIESEFRIICEEEEFMNDEWSDIQCSCGLHEEDHFVSIRDVLCSQGPQPLGELERDSFFLNHGNNERWCPVASAVYQGCKEQYLEDKVKEIPKFSTFLDV